MKITTAYLYVFDTMSDWEYGYLVAELRSGRYFKKGLEPLQMVTVGVNTEVVTTMGGIRIKPDISLDECTFEREDLVILPGGITWGADVNKPMLNKVGETLERGTLVAAICGAVDALAEAGYLNTRKHTTNSLEYTKMICPSYKGEELYVKEPAVACDNLITASGIAPIEFAVEVLKKLEVFHEDTLSAWYDLNKTCKPEYFYQLMGSMNR